MRRCTVRAVKGARIAAFVAALALFVVQVALALKAGVSAREALVVVLATFGVLALVVAVPVSLSLRAQERRVAELAAQRPGWVGVRAITALAAGTPASVPRRDQQRCALLLGPQGVELWTGKKAPYRLLFSASWADVTVSGAGVSYVPGRAVVKSGIRLVTTWGPPLHLTVFPSRSVQARFPAPTRVESVLAAMRGVQGGISAVVPHPGPDRS